MSKVWKFALLGRSISYSKSPDIFAAIAGQTGLAIEFAVRSIEPDRLEAEVSKLIAERFDGFSLTIPFKEQIISRLDHIDPLASQIRSVNCVACSDGNLTGYNTDLDGFSYSLLSYIEKLPHRSCLLLGTGGAARTVLYALLEDGLVSEVTVASRTAKSVSSLVSGVDPVDKVRNVSFTNLSQLHGESFGLVVNATPLGGWNHPDSLPLPNDFRFAKDTLYYDLNYNTDNKAIRFAQAQGCTTIDGSRMLVAQALKAFQLWTAVSVPFDPIYHTVFGKGTHA